MQIVNTRFKLIDSNIFLLPNNPHLVHLGTIKAGFKEYIVMYCRKGPKEGRIYIEEVVLTSIDWTKDVYANLGFIKDDNLARDLAEFARARGLLDPTRLLRSPLITFSNGGKSWKK